MAHAPGMKPETQPGLGQKHASEPADIGRPTFMVCAGVAVFRSQKRTVVSPEPVASRLPSGLKAVDNTASACPAHRPQLRDGFVSRLDLHQNFKSCR